MTDIKRANGIERVFLGITLAVLLLSLLFSVFYFGYGVFSRTVTGFKDLGVSIAYYACGTVAMYDVITPTVNVIPPNAVEVLPFDPEIFKAKLQATGDLFITSDNLKAYMQSVIDTVVRLAPIVMPMVMLLSAIVFLLRTSVKKQSSKNEEEEEALRNVPTKPLRIFMRIEDATWGRVKAFIKAYSAWLTERKNYVLFFCLIWAYNLNVFTIVLEALAYVLYLSVSLDFLHIFTQVAKLAMDLSVAANFLPAPIWAVIGWFVFDAIRKYIGIKTLEHYEAHNRQFLKDHPGALFLVGKQRAKKTSIITDMALSQDLEFRDNAKEGLLRRDKQFPYFPWVNVDKLYTDGQRTNALPMIQNYRGFIRRLELRFKYRERYEGTKLGEWVKWWNKKLYGYEYDNFIFDYDYERYGLEYDNGLTMVSVFEAVSNYVQQLYIYAAPTSLIFGNYSIRTDLIMKGKHFPKFDGNFFKRKARDVKANSGFCHIYDMDFSRLGTVVQKDNPYKDSFEVGCLNVMEIAKERGNQITNRGIKAESGQANVRNDKFEINMKMQTHGSTIDNYTYFRLFMDDQRPDSLGADNKDLSDIIMIKDASKIKSALPFSEIEKALGWVAGLFYDKMHLDEKENRIDNTLTMYLMRKIFSPVFHFIERRENIYAVYTANLRTTDGMRDEVLSDSDKYYLCKKKVYSDRFATDGIKSFYSKKAQRSKVGLNGLPCFKAKQMSVAEMEKTHSLFYRDITRMFTGGAQVEEDAPKEKEAA